MHKGNNGWGVVVVVGGGGGGRRNALNAGNVGCFPQPLLKDRPPMSAGLLCLF